MSTQTNPISEAQLAANRANAQHSSGPTSSEGKAKSSMNAVKTRLTGRTVLLTTDDALIYQQHLDAISSNSPPVPTANARSSNSSPIPNGVSSASTRSKPASGLSAVSS